MRPPAPRMCWRLAALAAATLGNFPAAAQQLPPGFVDQRVLGGLNQAVGVCFAPDGRGFVWEKAGRVWLLEGGALSAEPLIDIHEEVGNWSDFGLLGFTIDPQFLQNGRIYLLYVVDYHHLRHFGTPEYHPGDDEYYVDTISRLTRYTCNAADGFHSVDPASRRILIGETMGTGFPVTHLSHAIGTVAFGEDGTLLAGSGDGANFNDVDAGGPRTGSSNTALEDGIIQAYEDVGAFRAQLLDSLSGRIVRIDPETGDGVPGNPFYDPDHPRSARSRTWVMGLRNPFRFCVRAGTGQPDPAAADPGTLYIGEVGWNDREEVDVAPSGGLNFGWPLFEGLTLNSGYVAAAPPNLLAPDPLFGQGGCTLEHYRFSDLIVQATLAEPSWPEPCDPSQQVDPGAPRFVHTRPVLEWGHGGTVRTGIWNGAEAAEIEIDDPASPVQGTQFGGAAASGGVWYTLEAFPPEWRNVYFLADYVGGWMRALVFDADERPTEVRPFRNSAGAIVCTAVNPTDGWIYYVNLGPTGESELRRIMYGTDAPPSAAAAATPAYGPLPLTVQFSSEGSTDPEGLPLTFAWDFGDSSPPVAAPAPEHTYTGIIDLTDRGTIVARLFELDPPAPQGEGNPDPEVIRDRVYPPFGSSNAAQSQFDTSHGGDQGSDDWIGYTFDEPMLLSRVTFQEGQHFPDGGWFETLGVEIFDGQGWTPVSGLVVTPEYPGNDEINFGTFVLAFDPVEALGVRLRGQSGGVHHFISVAELRVGGVPVSLGGGPRRYDVRMTAADAAGQTDTASLVVSGNNTPPQVEILSPVDGSTYHMTGTTPIPLRAAISDLEHGPGSLSCGWVVVLHHNTHTHPEPAIDDCEPTVPLSPIGCDGETYSYEFSLTVTDADGLSTTRTAFVYPNCCLPDWNASGGVNSTDISAFLGTWLMGVNVPSLEADVDLSGSVNSSDISAFLTRWLAAVGGGGC